MHFPEGRASYLTLGALLYLLDDNGNGNVDGNGDGGNGQGRGGGQGLGSGDGVIRSLSSLLGTRPFLDLTADYHCRHRLDRMRFVSECLRIDQNTVSY